MPEALYDFFAEEVFSSLPDVVQEGLATLVVSPKIDRALAGRLLGAEEVEPVCEAALDVGSSSSVDRSCTCIHSRARISRTHSKAREPPGQNDTRHLHSPLRRASQLGRGVRSHRPTSARSRARASPGRGTRRAPRDGKALYDRELVRARGALVSREPHHLARSCGGRAPSWIPHGRTSACGTCRVAVDGLGFRARSSRGEQRTWHLVRRRLSSSFGGQRNVLTPVLSGERLRGAS